MREHHEKFPVGKMCEVFKVSRSSYYRWRKWKPSRRDNENCMLLFEIRRIHQKSKATYGSPRITRELQERGLKVSRPRVARLMKKAGIRAIRPKKFVATTDSRHKYPVVKNKLERNFTAERKGQVWVSDITYIKTRAGWLYLTAIIDLFDRKVVGWSISNGLKAEKTSVAAWRMAIKNRPPAEELVFHSDRGIQYACTSFTNVIKSCKGVERSMSRKGDCWDNAVAESFFKTIKTELIYRYRYERREAAAASVFEWIETWYNKNRRHSALDNLTIKEFENKMNQLKNAA